MAEGRKAIKGKPAARDKEGTYDCSKIPSSPILTTRKAKIVKNNKRGGRNS